MFDCLSLLGGLKMGTRADFYLGRGLQSEYLGSLKYDGYLIPDNLACATSVDRYLIELKKLFDSRSDAITDGWPWPWDDSALTDCVYSFDCGIVWLSYYNEPWIPAFDTEAKEKDIKPVHKLMKKQVYREG